MRKFTVGAMVTISLYTEVEADSPEQARELAENQQMPSLCHQCAGGEPEEQWCTSGEFDGVPDICSVEKS